jgi:hypothetical protein
VCGCVCGCGAVAQVQQAQAGAPPSVQAAAAPQARRHTGTRAHGHTGTQAHRHTGTHLCRVVHPDHGAAVCRHLAVGLADGHQRALGKQPPRGGRELPGSACALQLRRVVDGDLEGGGKHARVRVCVCLCVCVCVCVCVSSSAGGNMRRGSSSSASASASSSSSSSSSSRERQQRQGPPDKQPGRLLAGGSPAPRRPPRPRAPSGRRASHPHQPAACLAAHGPCARAGTSGVVCVCVSRPHPHPRTAARPAGAQAAAQGLDTHTHTHTRAHAHTHTHARTRARTHTRTHAYAHLCVVCGVRSPARMGVRLDRAGGLGKSCAGLMSCCMLKLAAKGACAIRACVLRRNSACAARICRGVCVCVCVCACLCVCVCVCVCGGGWRRSQRIGRSPVPHSALRSRVDKLGFAWGCQCAPGHPAAARTPWPR